MARLPERIGKYEIVRVLGKGGMGTVYLGRDADLDRSVAIKVLRNPLSDEELLQRFLREARAAANLRHENIITIYEVGEHDRQPFMAMEYVDGPSLGQVITARDPLPLGRRLSYIEQICAGLQHAHREGRPSRHLVCLVRGIANQRGLQLGTLDEIVTLVEQRFWRRTGVRWSETDPARPRLRRRATAHSSSI